LKVALGDFEKENGNFTETFIDKQYFHSLKSLIHDFNLQSKLIEDNFHLIVSE
jgi:hypothetical protein